jgi:hypothetical protein
LASSFPASFAFHICLTDMRAMGESTEYTERREKK